MPSKTEEYLALAQRTANGLTRYWESWTDYLTTASRLYKYNYADQLMIYAQRPDATACASFDLWNDRMNRYVRRGSKGIALLDQSSSVPRLHYVFDVSDTGVRRNSRDPEVWQLGPDLVQPVSEMLTREYGVRHERITQQIADICGKLVDSYWDNNSGDILDIVDGSFLMDYDEAGQEFQFKSAAAISITYTVLERCGFEPAGHFDRDDFQAIFSFSTPAAVYALGTAVSECSRDVLRNIERTVKTTIRRRNVERSQYEYEQPERDLLDHRGLSAPEPDPAPAGESTGQVRTTAPDLPDEVSPGAVQLDAPVGDSASAPAGRGADRRAPDAADHAGAAEAKPGSEQGAISDGVGAAHEQPESTGRGTGDERADLQLSFFDAHQALLKGQRKYPVALGKDPLGCIIRLDHSLNNFPERITSAENELATLKQQQAAAQIEVEKPFPQEEELAEKSARLAELNAQLDMDEKSHEPEQDEEPRRSSVLAALEEKADKVEPIKPFKSYLDKDGDAR